MSWKCMLTAWSTDCSASKVINPKPSQRPKVNQGSRVFFFFFVTSQDEEQFKGRGRGEEESPRGVHQGNTEGPWGWDDVASPEENKAWGGGQHFNSSCCIYSPEVMGNSDKALKPSQPTSPKICSFKLLKTFPPRWYFHSEVLDSCSYQLSLRQIKHYRRRVFAVKPSSQSHPNTSLILPLVVSLSSKCWQQPHTC